jgi:hypothetical protein
MTRGTDRQSQSFGFAIDELHRQRGSTLSRTFYIRDILEAWIASIARELPWSDETARRSFAEMVVASLEGAFILSRARQSGAPFITVGQWLATILERVPRNACRRTTGKQKRQQHEIPKQR